MDSLKLSDRDDYLHKKIYKLIKDPRSLGTTSEEARAVAALFEPLVRAALDLGLVYVAKSSVIAFHPPHVDNPNHYHAATTWQGVSGAYRDHENTEAAINSFRKALSDLLDLDED